MRVLILVSLLLAVFCAPTSNNVVQIGMTGQQLVEEMQKDANKNKMYVVMFKKVNVEDKALMAANDNQKEGIINRLNSLAQLSDDKKANFQVVEVNESNKVLLKKWKVKEGAADKRPVFLVARGGVGKTFSGPLATTKAKEYFFKNLPTDQPTTAAAKCNYKPDKTLDTTKQNDATCPAKQA